MKSFTGKENEKLSKFLLKAYDGALSFSMLNKLFRKKDIKIDGKRVSVDLTLSGGEIIEVYYDGETKSDFAELYLDENVLVAVKPKGITSEDFYRELSKKHDGLYFCHRLDRNTDGVMIFALNEIAYNEIVYGFKNRTFKKLYRAEVYGRIEKDEEILNAYLIKDSEKSLVKIYDNSVKNSKPIATKYKVLERKEFSTVLEVELLTGRTHQIRAHLAYIGHFILGDGKYGVESINRKLCAKTLMLTAKSLTLEFPDGSCLAYLTGKTFSI